MVKHVLQQKQSYACFPAYKGEFTFLSGFSVFLRESSVFFWDTVGCTGALRGTLGAGELAEAIAPPHTTAHFLQSGGAQRALGWAGGCG